MIFAPSDKRSQEFITPGICVVAITDQKVGSFSDISFEHKIFSHGRICALLRDCRKSPKRAILAILHVMKSNS